MGWLQQLLNGCRVMKTRLTRKSDPAIFNRAPPKLDDAPPPPVVHNYHEQPQICSVRTAAPGCRV